MKQTKTLKETITNGLAGLVITGTAALGIGLAGCTSAPSYNGVKGNEASIAAITTAEPMVEFDAPEGAGIADVTSEGYTHATLPLDENMSGYLKHSGIVGVDDSTLTGDAVVLFTKEDQSTLSRELHLQTEAGKEFKLVDLNENDYAAFNSFLEASTLSAKNDFGYDWKTLNDLSQNSATKDFVGVFLNDYVSRHADERVVVGYTAWGGFGNDNGMHVVNVLAAEDNDPVGDLMVSNNSPRTISLEKLNEVAGSSIVLDYLARGNARVDAGSAWSAYSKGGEIGNLVFIPGTYLSARKSNDADLQEELGLRLATTPAGVKPTIAVHFARPMGENTRVEDMSGNTLYTGSLKK